MRRRVIQIHPRDNVAVAVLPLAAGETIEGAGRAVIVKESITVGHKIALRPLVRGGEVIKYGRRIGFASLPVEEGAWVHTHNLKTALRKKQIYPYQPAAKKAGAAPPPPGAVPAFRGYRRSGGRAGTRNEIWIIPSVGCVNQTAVRLAALANERFKGGDFDGVFAFPHPLGCSQLGGDLDNTRRILSALMRHPNAGGVLALGLGCETLQLDVLTGDTAGLDTARVRAFGAQAAPDELETGLRAIGELFEIMSRDRRVDVPASELVLGVKCGGSDAFSGISANPVVGRVADWATSVNATVLLSEVPEMFGAEQALMNRARNKKVFDQVVRLINGFKQYYAGHGQPVHENPSPGNKAGGITTLEEKALGAVEKGGGAAVTQVLEYGERASERGLVLLDAPGNDIVSSTALAASGATLLLFTTGRGTPLGGPVPTLKISSTTDLARRKPQWIDFDAGELVSAGRQAEEIAGDLVRLVIEVASGTKKTKSEILGNREFAIWKNGVTL